MKKYIWEGVDRYGSSNITENSIEMNVTKSTMTIRHNAQIRR